MRTELGLILVAAILAALPVNAEFYKYVDENGNIRFTDDITVVPRDQREKLREYEDYVNESDEDSTPPDADSAAPAAETPEPEPEQAQGTNEEITAQGKRLEKEKAALDTEYKALMDARRMLEERRGEFRTKSAIKEYETQILELNKRNAAYEAKRQAYDQEALEYNTKIDQLREPAE